MAPVQLWRRLLQLSGDPAQRVREALWQRLHSCGIHGRDQQAGSGAQAIAEEMGWSREAARNYAGLAKIDRRAWSVIGTAFRSGAAAQEEDAVPSVGTTVPFTAGSSEKRAYQCPSGNKISQLNRL
jgi:hypothetical protein